MSSGEEEKRFAKWVNQQGGSYCIKWVAPGTSGVPDRIVLMSGRAIFFEFKNRGEQLRPLQRVWKRKLESLGFEFYVVYSASEAKDYYAKEKDKISGGGS